jgi:hypothetical protein
VILNEKVLAQGTLEVMQIYDPCYHQCKRCGIIYECEAVTVETVSKTVYVSAATNNILLLQSKEIGPPDTNKQQFNVVENTASK